MSILISDKYKDIDDCIESINTKLSECLDEYRYKHTLGVANTAASLAKENDYDDKKAYLAGLLHDCAKAYSSSEYVNMARERNIAVNEVEYNHPGLLHAKLGASFAGEIYGVYDQDILNSIICHTTGKPEMTLLDKIVYISDYIEPGRSKQERLAEIREEAHINLDKCLLMILEDSYNYISSYDKTCIDPMTEETYHYYKKLLKD